MRRLSSLLPTKGKRRLVAERAAEAATATGLTLFVNVQVARAAAGDLDPTFGRRGRVMTDLARSTDIANAVAVQPDGKLVVVGTT